MSTRHPAPIAPADWPGPLHERPGLFWRSWQHEEHAERLAREAETSVPVFELPSGWSRPATVDALPQRAWPAVVAAVCAAGFDYRVIESTAWFMIEKELAGRIVHVPSKVDASTLRISHQVDRHAAVALFLDGAFGGGWCWTVGPDGQPDDIPTKVGARCWHPRCWDAPPLRGRGAPPCKHAARPAGWPWASDHRGADDTVRAPRPPSEFGRTERPRRKATRR